ncbi:MAG: amidohydrolase family protein [Bacteroidota bacterium]
MRFRLLAIFLIFLVASCAAPEEKQFVDLLITNAHVVDVREGSVLRDQTIALQDGRILHVGDDSKNYDSESKINAKGKYLIPGLWDMHVHFRGGQDLIQENKNLLPLFLANGITTVRDAGGDITNSVQIWSAEIKKGNLDGPRIFTSGPKLDGIDPTWAGSIELEKTEDVANALDSLESIGADYVKIYDSKISRDVYLEIIRQAEGRGMLTTGHMPFTVKLEEAIEAGLDATEHAYYVFKGASPKEDSLTNLAIQGWDSGKPVSFGRQLQLYYDSYDNLKAAELFSKMAETGTSILPTLYIGRVLSRLKEDKHIRDPELNYIGPEIRKTYLRRLNSALRAPDESTAFGQKLSEKFIDMIPLMHEAGVNILAGSDCGPYNTFIYPGFSLHSELQLLVEAGIPVKEVLRIATLS